MPDLLYLKPGKGLQVRIPHTDRHLPAKGMTVESSIYWRRRLACGDVMQTTPEPPLANPAIAAARAQVDTMATAAREVLVVARQGGGVEAGTNALEQYLIKIAPLSDEAAKLAESMSDDDIEAVEAYAREQLEPLRVELESLASSASSEIEQLEAALARPAKGRKS